MDINNVNEYISKNNKKDVKKGISLVALVIVIIILLILTTTIVITVLGDNPIEDANEATIKSDIQAMKDKYKLTYEDLLFKKFGDETKIKDSDFEEVVPDKYKDTFVATKDGLEYIGEDKKVEEIAKEMGLGSEEKYILEYITAVGKQTSVEIEAVIKDGQIVDEYVYYIREKGKENWEEFSRQENKIIIENLKESTEYEVKVIVKQGEKEYESQIKEVVTKELNIGTLIMKLNDETGEEYEVGTWTKENVYIEVEGINTTYSVSGANEVEESSSAKVIKNEGISKVTVKTKSGDTIKTKEYTIKIDKSIPEVVLVSNNTKLTQENITLTGTGKDNVSGIFAYQFSEDGNLTESSNGWNIVESTKEIIKEYTVKKMEHIIST